VRLDLLVGVVVVSALGCDEGAAVEAHAQTIGFSATPSPAVDQTSLFVSATASSGLPVRYRSLTPAVCSVDSDTGLVTGLTSGTCTIAAQQPGDSHYAPAQATQSLVFTFTRETPASITGYQVVVTFYEPDTQPNDAIFVGEFTLDATTGTVSNLRGVLSEAMTGGESAYPHDTMTWLQLDYQLSTVATTIDGMDGLLVTSFRWPSTDTLSVSPELGGTDGFSPGTGMGRYYGYPEDNPGNAYARIFVNLSNPTAVPTQAQIDKLAYADCAPGGMMGATCMTGTAPSGYGRSGTMSGYPKAQIIVKR
jgi:hypothetical protein